MKPAGATWMFLFVSFGVSWGVWLPLVLGVELPLGYYYLAALGPALGALVAEGGSARARAGGPGVLRAWLKTRLGAPGPGHLWGWVIGGLALGVVAAAVLEASTTGDLRGWATLGTTAELPGWSPWAVVPLLTLSYGLCEELGWRGWLFPTWSRLWGPRRAALAVGGVWCLWHLPAFFCNPTYQAMGWAAVGWVFSLVAGSILLSWMVVEARGSLWPVVAWHSAFDALTVSDAAAIALAPVLSTVVLLTVPVVWHLLKEKTVVLSKSAPEPRHLGKETL